jgi:hypothetical protein
LVKRLSKRPSHFGGVTYTQYIKEKKMDIKEKLDSVLSKTDIDDKIKAKVDEVLAGTDLDDKAKAKIKEALDKTDLDEQAVEKFNATKDKAIAAATKAELDKKVGGRVAQAKAKIDEVLAGTDLDEKAVAKINELLDKTVRDEEVAANFYERVGINVSEDGNATIKSGLDKVKEAAEKAAADAAEAVEEAADDESAYQ